MKSIDETEVYFSADHDSSIADKIRTVQVLQPLYEPAPDYKYPSAAA